MNRRFNMYTTHTTQDRRSHRLLRAAALALLLTLAPAGALAQKSMKITLADGRTLLTPIDSIAHIGIEAEVPAVLAQLAGQWQLIASANGTTDAYGISHALTDTIDFTAQVAPDGLGLLCQADRFWARASSGNVYPATWRMLAEEDEATGRIRLGWVFSQEEPASSREFSEPPADYMDGGLFYWGTGSEAHRYVYLLTENIEQQRLEGATLWSAWQQAAEPQFAFPQNQGIYAVVASAIPYAPAAAIGYFERWASPRFVKAAP